MQCFHAYPDRTRLACDAHRAALAAMDSDGALQTLRNTERRLIHLWMLDARINKRTSNDCFKPSGNIHLIRTCKTRWLSCNKAGGIAAAALSEITAVWKTFQSFGNERNDPTANGMLGETKKFDFILNLQLLNCVLLHLSSISRLFQTDDLYNSSPRFSPL